jgi:dihydropteroate synthase
MMARPLGPIRPLPATHCGEHVFTWGKKTYVMGILNVTTDSFSGDGIIDPDEAVAQGIRLADEGADIVDVGGESTRPGSTPIGADEELRRVIPVIERLHGRLRVPISVDTYRASVAAAALAAGATVVNDVWGFTRDPELAGVVARWSACAVAMHNLSGRVRPAAGLGGFFPDVVYEYVVADVAARLRSSVETLSLAGVPTESILVDPGLGFGKTPRQNLQILARLHELTVLGQPLLIGPSRKSFVGLSLNLPPAERVEGTAATVALGILNGADVVRVHDVLTMTRVARATDAIVYGVVESGK